MKDEKTNNYWFISLVISIPIFILFVLLVIFAGGWLHNLWFNYGWASDKGNGPEAVQQTLLYATAAAILIPAVRHFVKREFDKIHAKIENGHDELHQKLDHIIHFHPDIPAFIKREHDNV